MRLVGCSVLLGASDLQLQWNPCLYLYEEERAEREVATYGYGIREMGKSDVRYKAISLRRTGQEQDQGSWERGGASGMARKKARATKPVAAVNWLDEAKLRCFVSKKVAFGKDGEGATRPGCKASKTTWGAREG